MKFQKKNWGGGGGRVGSWGWGSVWGGEGQGRCEQRSEVFVKIQKNNFGGGGRVGRGGGGRFEGSG